MVSFRFVSSRFRFALCRRPDKIVFVTLRWQIRNIYVVSHKRQVPGKFFFFKYFIIIIIGVNFLSNKVACVNTVVCSETSDCRRVLWNDQILNSSIISVRKKYKCNVLAWSIRYPLLWMNSSMDPSGGG